MDPELAAVLSATPADLPPRPPTIDEMRAFFDSFVGVPYKAYYQRFLPSRESYIVKDYSVPVKGGEITARVVVPVVEDSNETFPVFVHYHGGGWSLGDVDVDDYALRRLAVDFKLSVVNVGYRLAPEHVFPTAPEDCFAALKWTAENTTLIKGDLGKGFIVGGHSAGANLSAVVAHEARDDPFFEGRRLTGQLLREPSVVHPATYPENLKSEFRSFEENKDIQPLPSATIIGMFDRYQPDVSDPRFAPLLYPSHAGLPRAFVHAMALDPLRDDGVVYAKVLQEAGVETRLEVYPGVSHGFHYNYPTISAAEKVREGAVNGLKWLLRRESR
ncbi:Alpha/Beta hydrolase protein [Trametes elegans]|nr:Alpha/Beta hydrolase protein [Trametes elegans]